MEFKIHSSETRIIPSEKNSNLLLHFHQCYFSTVRNLSPNHTFYLKVLSEAKDIRNY